MRLIIFAVILSTAFARPQSGSNAIILSYENESDPSGAYRFSYETSDFQKREEQGFIKNAGTENEALSVTGSYSYIGTDGNFYVLSYTADENGFHPRESSVEGTSSYFINTNKKFDSLLSKIESERKKNVNE